jgi:lipoate-protein ligase A
MNYLDVTLSTPAENLACDEALLEWAEEHGGSSVLRFWESQQHFVVLGYANKVAEEVNIEACRACGFPILRRCSGGGTVLQGPGCLNYSVILKIDEDGPLQGITGTNTFVMQHHRRALASLLEKPVMVEGFTDLATEQLKFSGNAQRRKRNWLLFHGTFLLNFDLDLIEKILPPPPRQPDYRRKRPHSEFLTQLMLPAEAVKTALREAWNSTRPLEVIPNANIARLVSEKYATNAWNFKW